MGTPRNGVVKKHGWEIHSTFSDFVQWGRIKRIKLNEMFHGILMDFAAIRLLLFSSLAPGGKSRVCYGRWPIEFEFTSQTWLFSIAMSNYWRVI